MGPVSVVVDTRGRSGRNTISKTGIAILFIIVMSVLCVAVHEAKAYRRFRWPRRLAPGEAEFLVVGSSFCSVAIGCYRSRPEAIPNTRRSVM